MPKVGILPPDVAEKIAAGEVIERPASVVKELVENALDAGAQSIRVELEKGGKTLIRVADDGEGMSREDLELSFHRHATSKIKSVDDLFAINTMGFRGEALASIAAVARVRTVTRAADDENAWEATIEPPSHLEIKPAGRARGTTVEVRDLFFSIPARKKFLSRDETELGHITRYLQAMALSFPHVAMSLANGKRVVFEAGAASSVRRRLAAFYGEDMAEDLLEAEGGHEGLTVYALIAPPFYSRTNSYGLYTYVNGRYVRDRVLSGAVSQAFSGIMEPRRYPVAFVYVTIAPEEVDVNVHPAKMEIRFRDSGKVRGVVSGVLSGALLKADIAPRIREGEAGGSPRAENIYRSIEAFYDRRVSAGDYGAQGWSQGGGRFAGQGQTGDARTAGGEPLGQGSLLQVKGTYIVQETDEGIAIIDQHALHERIVYADVRRRLAEGNLAGQRLLIPDVVEVTPEERLAVERSRDLLARLGMDAEIFGDDTVAFNSFPAALADAKRDRLARDVISDLVASGSSRSIDEALTAMAELIACHAAVRAGDALGAEELEALLAKAENTESRYACPHGRPTKLVLTFDELERRFKRR